LRCDTAELAGALMMPRPFVQRVLDEHGFEPRALARAVVCTTLFAAVRMATVVYGEPLLRCIEGGASQRVSRPRAR
jgi:hypothetical protein